MKTILKLYYAVALIMGVFLMPQALMAQVTEEWVARYNGLGNGTDLARAISVDATGNVYVTGTSWGSGTSNDYATVKYDSSGNQMWVARYNGPGNGSDDAFGILLDANGNVYVTGYSVGTGTSNDYATVKYDTNGNQMWVARYNGPGNSTDIARAISVDATGNIYVTGDSWGSGTSIDYATVKYDSNGNQMWVSRYNGPGNSTDIARAISVDAAGNIYVTGDSVGSGTSNDYATVKYDSNGNQMWVSRYNGPGNSWDVARAISVDAAGNIYVTGDSWGSGTSNDYATVKYDTNGNQIWVSRYNGLGNVIDIATAISVDATGNIYVTGNSWGSGTYYDYATVKYDSNGNQMWVSRYNGPGNSWDVATAISVDTNGNVYVTGNSTGSGTYYDYATVKYDSNGNQMWVSRFNGPENADDITRAISVDVIGNVYVTGNSVGTGISSFDYVTVKYSQCTLNTYYQDSDSDTYGNVSVTTQACTQPAGYVTDNTDCNDWDASINPGAAEACNGVDDNCNAQIDEGVENTYYADTDSDTYGNPSAITQACSLPSGYVTNNADCDDGNAFVNPSVAEVCNGVDDNCNVLIDEGVQNTYYQDADNDTYGNASASALACTQPSGYVSDNTDCNDGDASVNPGAAEVCNGVDDNCNGLTDDGLTFSSYYRDADGDGYGNTADSVSACMQPVGRVLNDTDCDDSNPTVYPGAVEIPNDGIDQDCSGSDLAVESRVDSGSSGDQRYPWVDYNETTSEYLVLWQDKRNGTNDDIYGVRIDQNGNRIGSDFAVSTASGHQQRVLVKAGGGGYLALWHDLRNQSTNGADIYGAWIDGSGVVGPEMAMCACAKDQWNPVAGYDSVSNTFLVVFLSGTGSGTGNDAFDLWGAMIPAGGTIAVSPFPMVIEPGAQRGPQIGYDYGNNQYYMAWNDRRGGVNYDIYGSRVTTTGTLLDGTGVLLSGAAGNQFRPTVLDRRPSAGINNHLIAWTDYRNGSQADVYGIYVDGSGTAVGSDFAISTNAADQQNVVADTDWINTQKSLVAFIDQRNGTDYDIYGAGVDQAGVVTGDMTVVGQATGAAGEQRAEVVTYATDGINDYGFLTVWMDRRNGTDYDIYGIKVWP